MVEVNITEARKNLVSLIERAGNGELFKLTRYGKPIAVIIGYEDWEKIKAEKNKR